MIGLNKKFAFVLTESDIMIIYTFLHASFNFFRIKIVQNALIITLIDLYLLTPYAHKHTRISSLKRLSRELH